MSIIELAERIIRGSNREHPADAVLRQELRAHSELFPREAAEVSRAVFSFYRWQGWLDTNRLLRDQIRETSRLAEHFAREPKSFSDSDLLARAVPAWTGQEIEVTAAWVRTLQSEPRLWLRAKRDTGPELANKLGDCRPLGAGILADTLEYRGHKDLFRTDSFHAGKFEIQDLSSQIVGLVCGPQPGETWWDACAGEGGKLLHLSELMNNKGLIWASDPALWRLQKLKRRAARAQVFNYRAAPWDGGPKLPTKSKFDGILVDAPCSGIGTWQRNPHARWTTTSHDVQELGAIQRHLLARVVPALKPGGKLIYAVCTLTRLETTEVVAALHQQAPQLRPLPMRNPLTPQFSPTSTLSLWPQDSGGNGMFIAAFRMEGAR